MRIRKPKETNPYDAGYHKGFEDALAASDETAKRVYEDTVLQLAEQELELKALRKQVTLLKGRLKRYSKVNQEKLL